MFKSLYRFAILSTLLVVDQTTDAFTATTTTTTTPSRVFNRHNVVTLQASNLDDTSTSPIDAFIADAKVRFRIAQESNAEGASFKQTLANVIAGEYDEEKVKMEMEELINSAPCGKFTLFVYMKGISLSYNSIYLFESFYPFFIRQKKEETNL